MESYSWKLHNYDEKCAAIIFAQQLNELIEKRAPRELWVTLAKNPALRARKFQDSLGIIIGGTEGNSLLDGEENEHYQRPPATSVLKEGTSSNEELAKQTLDESDEKQSTSRAKELNNWMLEFETDIALMM